MATTVPKTWPTLDDVHSFHAEIVRGTLAAEMIDSDYRTLVDPEVAPSVRQGVPRPTIEDVGVLSMIAAHVAFEADVLKRFAESLQAAAAAVALETGPPSQWGGHDV